MLSRFLGRRNVYLRSLKLRFNRQKSQLLYQSWQRSVSINSTPETKQDSKTQRLRSVLTSDFNTRKDLNVESQGVNNLDMLAALGRFIWPKETGHWDVKGRVLATVALLASAKLINIQVPFFFKDIVDTLAAQSTAAEAAAVSPDYAMAVPVALVVGYGSARITAAICQEMRNGVFSYVTARAVQQVGHDVFRHLLNLDMRFHVERRTGSLNRIVERGSRATTWIMNAMTFHIAPTLLELGLVNAIICHQFGWQAAVITNATLLSYVLFTISVSGWRTKFLRAKNQLENQASQLSLESLINFETIALFGKQDYECRRYQDIMRDINWASQQTAKSLALLNGGQSVIISVGLTAMMLLASQGVVIGHLTTGDLVLINGLVFQLAMPLNMAGTVYREVRQSLIDMEALFALKQIKSTLGEVSKPIALPGEGDLKFENVSFRYSEHGPQVLDGVTFTAQAGRTTAVVGTSGCGKSTIIRLLCRFYDPDEGTVRVNGVDTRDVELSALRASIGVVPQDTILFNDSIGSNINYGRQDGAESGPSLQHVAEKAQIHNVISRLKDGYETHVGERGVKLSGGEKQRVSIARAVLKDAPILLCDEATSALDSNTEVHIMEHLRDLGKGRTTVMIAHRLSTIQHADRIVLLEAGKVAEVGTHEELLSRPDGLYAAMWWKQNKKLRDCPSADGVA